jgi:hypothetical protein
MRESALDLYAQRAEHSTMSVDPLTRSGQPIGFDCAYITACETAYEQCGSDGRPTGDGGVLPAGKIVWGSPTLLPADGRRPSKSLQVYVGTSGTVLLNPRTLRALASPTAGAAS